MRVRQRSRPRFVAGLAVALLAGGCGSSGARSEPDEALAAVRQQVAALRSAVDTRLDPEIMLAGEALEAADVVVRLRVGMLQELLTVVASQYLDDVQLHFSPGTVALEDNEVRTRIGPIRVRAGRWTLHVSINDIRATLRAGEPTITVDSDNRFALHLPAQVESGTGTARIKFEWDAATVISVVCRDFQVDETFSATVRTRDYELDGHFRITPVDGSLVLDPSFPQRLDVQPEPTEESWAHVREILAEQDKMFRCGLALNADNMEAKLREILHTGFRFGLPDSVLRPITMPSSVSETIELGGHMLGVAASPAGLRLTSEWLWYGIDIELTHEDEAPHAAGPELTPGASSDLRRRFASPRSP